MRATEGYLCGTCGKTPTDKTSKKKLKEGEKRRRKKTASKNSLLGSTFVLSFSHHKETIRVKKKKKKKKKNLMMCTTFTTTNTTWLGVTPRRPHRGATTGNANGRRVASNGSSNSNGKALSIQQIKVDKNAKRRPFRGRTGRPNSVTF